MPTPFDPLLPDDYGQVYVSSTAGIRCIVTATEVRAQNDEFTCAPMVDGGRANGVRFTSAGELSWVLGDLGNIPVIEIDSTYTYPALGWTIDTAADGALHFTNDSSGRTLTVSVDGAATGRTS